MLMNDKSGWTCYDAAKKSVLWKIDNKADSIGNHFLLSQMFYCKGIVISGIGPTAYDAQTGKTVWQKNETGIGEGFVVNDIFLSWKAINPDDSKTRYAISGFRATDGLLAWKIDEFETPPRACWASCNKDRFLIKNVCFEYSTGKKLFELRDMPKYNAKTMFDDSGNIIAYSASGIHLYDGKTGNLIKSRNLGLSKNVVSFNSRIYCFNRETSSLLCLNPKTLETQWSVKADAADDCMIVASGYNLVLVSRKGVSGYGCGSGKLLWTRGDEKLLDIRKTSYYAIVDRHIYASTLDWSFQTFTRRLSIAP
jgi:outer membrane protein assembly factor BamB